MNRSHAHVVPLHPGGRLARIVFFDHRGRWTRSSVPMLLAHARKERNAYNQRMRKRAQSIEAAKTLD